MHREKKTGYRQSRTIHNARRQQSSVCHPVSGSEKSRGNRLLGIALAGILLTGCTSSVKTEYPNTNDRLDTFDLHSMTYLYGQTEKVERIRNHNLYTITVYDTAGRLRNEIHMWDSRILTSQPLEAGDALLMAYDFIRETFPPQYSMYVLFRIPGFLEMQKALETSADWMSLPDQELWDSEAAPVEQADLIFSEQIRMVEPEMPAE